MEAGEDIDDLERYSVDAYQQGIVSIAYNHYYRSLIFMCLGNWSRFIKLVSIIPLSIFY
jgi:hypothetical protein